MTLQARVKAIEKQVARQPRRRPAKTLLDLSRMTDEQIRRLQALSGIALHGDGKTLDLTRLSDEELEELRTLTAIGLPAEAREE